LFGALIAGVSDGLVAGPLAVVRLVEAAVLVGLVLVTRRPWRVERPLWPGIVLVGVLDMGGNLFYLASIQAYRLDVAAAISSLYPVVTVILAAAILRERITGSHGVGVALAGLAIVLIAAGNAQSA
jgi:drug/metabolite transporter (DMT)-like permease